MSYMKRVLDEILQLRRVAAKSRRHRRIESWDRVEPCGLIVLWSYFSDDEVLFGVFGMSRIQEALGGAKKSATDPAAADPQFAATYPTLSDFMISHEVIDGRPRQTSTMIVVCEEGLWKLGLRERDRNVSLWVSGVTMEDAMLALEAALNEPVVAWRRSPADKGYNQNRK